MNEIMLIKLVNLGIPLLLLIGVGIVLHLGLKKSQALLTQREELLKRYLLFRGDKQVRLKIYGQDEKVYRDLLRNISKSWKKFKAAYDLCLLSLLQNTTRTKRFLVVLVVALLLNTGRVLADEYYFYGFQDRFFYAFAGELSEYVLVIIAFVLLRAQSQKFIALQRNSLKLEREIFFFPNTLSPEGDREVLYDEFDPLEPIEGDVQDEDEDHGR
jgi:hypothetical protein